MAENPGAFFPEVTGTVTLLRLKGLALSVRYDLVHMLTLQVPVTGTVSLSILSAYVQRPLRWYLYTVV